MMKPSAERGGTQAALPGAPVTPEERRARQAHRGAVVWMTGFSSAGKSTIATALERALFDRHVHVIVLDGDVLRRGLNANLGFSAEDRAENIRRLAEVSALFAATGTVVVAALISPYRSDRERARHRLAAACPDAPFIEVHVDAPLAICESRDPKGLYARARAGELSRFTGVSDPYEPPTSPEVHVRTDEQPVSACVDAILVRVLDAIGR